MAAFPEKRTSGLLWSGFVLGMIVVLPLGVYAASLGILASQRGQPVQEVLVFLPEAFPHSAFMEQLAVIAGVVGACGVLFAAPVLLGTLVFRAQPARREMAHLWSIASNVTALMGICLCLRETVGINRATFLPAWCVWTIGLAVWAGRDRAVLLNLGEVWQANRMAGLGGLITFAIGLSLFGADQFLPCFEGDGVESFELTRSLKEHFLPTWENEPIDRFGAVVVNPALVNSYATLGMHLLLGEGEFATRLPFWVYWLGVFWIACRIQTRFGPPSWGGWVALGLGILLVAQWYTFYVGYDPYMADLANPGVPDAMFTLFLILAFEALWEQDLAAWGLAMFLGSLVLYAGPVMLVLQTLAALIWKPVERRRMLRAAAMTSGCLIAVAGLYLAWGWWTGMLEGWWATFQSEYWLSYINPIPRTQLTLLYVGYFLLGVGGVSALALIDAFRRSPWERTLASVMIAYLCIVLGSAAKNLHYLGPLFPCALLLWIIPRTVPNRFWRAAVATVGLCLSLLLCWPPARPNFTLTRELGQETTFQTDSYEDACRWADLAALYDLGVTSWDVPPHTWVKYSTLESQPRKRRAILVTTADMPPPGYVIRAEEVQTGVKVCLDLANPERLQWAKSQAPLIGPDRFPWVLSDMALKPRPKKAMRTKGSVGGMSGTGDAQRNE